MSENKFTYQHGVIAMLIEMSASDGEIDKKEITKLYDIVSEIFTKGDVDATQKIISETLDAWSGFETVQDRCSWIVSLALQIGDNLTKPNKAGIGRMLVAIAGADGNIHENEKGFMLICMGCLDITFDDLKR